VVGGGVGVRNERADRGQGHQERADDRPRAWQARSSLQSPRHPVGAGGWPRGHRRRHARWFVAARRESSGLTETFIETIEIRARLAYDAPVATEETEWLSTAEAARRLGITSRTLYRFLDQGELPGYRFGRVIRLKAAEVDEFIEGSRLQPGDLANLYPKPVVRDAD
jgi:excisionase family DNA binding protein